jgi:rRNA maturation protein Nop10
MSDICDECGGEIIFRYMSGVKTPIHLSGGCGGGSSWSGGGYGSSSSDRFRSDGNSLAEDFCRKTTCPICGEDVFFIRHNGGSFWADRLGKPWPKHGCFDDLKINHLAARLQIVSAPLSEPLLGIVIAVTPKPREHTAELVVIDERQNRLLVQIANIEIHEANGLRGEIVIIAWKARKLIHPAGFKSHIITELTSANIPTASPPPESPSTASRAAAPRRQRKAGNANFTKCPQCGSSVKPENLSRHLRKTHGQVGPESK